MRYASIFLMIFLSGCIKTACCTSLDYRVAIKFENADGENLLDLPDGLDPEAMTLVYRRGDLWQPYYRSEDLTPNGLSAEQLEDGTYLTFLLSPHVVSENHTETRLVFPDDEVVLLRAEIDFSHGNETVRRVWYDGELRWERGRGQRGFTVVR